MKISVRTVPMVLLAVALSACGGSEDELEGVQSGGDADIAAAASGSDAQGVDPASSGRRAEALAVVPARSGRVWASSCRKVSGDWYTSATIIHGGVYAILNPALTPLVISCPLPAAPNPTSSTKAFLRRIAYYDARTESGIDIRCHLEARTSDGRLLIAGNDVVSTNNTRPYSGPETFYDTLYVSDASLWVKAGRSTATYDVLCTLAANQLYFQYLEYEYQ